MKRIKSFGAAEYIIFTAATLAVLIICVCLGSVSVPMTDLFSAVFGGAEGSSSAIVLVRLRRVICAALTGAALSLCGGAMQGLLKNPLADGSTLGVSSGASLGAVAAIAFGLTIPSIPLAGTIVFAMAAAFTSLMIILALAYRLDSSLATNTIILIGVIFSMFASSLISLIISFNSEKIKQITFWTMGSLSGTGFEEALILLIALVIFGGIILSTSKELNAFALGEENALSVGVNVKKVKLTVMICVSALIGVCVSIGGTIGFVGLIIPHITRMLTGPDHRKLLPACVFSGSIFLMLSDLAARTIVSPTELPIGVVTSLIGAVVFVIVFFKTRRAK